MTVGLILDYGSRNQSETIIILTKFGKYESLEFIAITTILLIEF